MYVTVVQNRGSPPAVLLRGSYRGGAKVKNRTIANLSKWPPEKVKALRAVLRGDRLTPAAWPPEKVKALRAVLRGDRLTPAGEKGSRSSAPFRMAM